MIPSINTVISRMVKALETLEAGSEMTSASLADLLNAAGDLEWKTQLPVSYVHNGNRIKSDTQRSALIRRGFLDKTGVSREGLFMAELGELALSAPGCLQTIALAACSEGFPEAPVFRAKRPGDFWKRLADTGKISVMADLDLLSARHTLDAAVVRTLEASTNGQWEPETALRDAVRSKKENGGLREKPFVWIMLIELGSIPFSEATVHPEAMLHHYFGENVVTGTMKNGWAYCLGYMPKLDDISLRTFYKKR